MKYQGDKVQFEATRNCRLNGVQYAKGDVVEVTLVRDFDPAREIGNGGPWGYGAYSSRFVASLGEVETQSGGRIVLRGVK